MSYQTKLEQLEQKKAALQKSSPARDRLVALFDEGTFVELDAFAACGEEGVGVITATAASRATSFTPFLRT